VKRVSPIRTRDGKAIDGRLTKKTGRQAMRKRNAVSCAAEKLSSASLVATKAKPQTTEVSAARTMSRTGIAPPPCDGAKRYPAHLRQLRTIRRRPESAGALISTPERCH